MTPPDADGTDRAAVHDAGPAGARLAAPPARLKEPPIPTKAKSQNIRVAPAVLDAARKDGEALLRDLRTSLAGLTQAEAEERARATGPNEIAQERKQGWPVRVLKIIRNPLVILLTILSAVCFLTGDASAGSVIAGMVALSEHRGNQVFILFIGPISSIFDYTTFFVMLWIFNCWDPSRASVFQTGWFVESLMTQTLIIHVIRTNKIPFIQSRASWPLTATTLSIMAFGMWLPNSPLAPSLGLVQLPRLYWPILMLTLLSYVSLTQVIKVWLLRKKWI